MPHTAHVRTGYAALAAIAVLALAGCTGSPTDPTGSGENSGAASAPPSAPADPEPTPLTEEELQLRALTIDDFPTPGYTPVPNGSGDGSGNDSSDAGVCQLNLTALVAGGSGEPDFPYVQSAFERASTNDHVYAVVASVPDPVGFVSDIEDALSACPSSSSASNVAVTIDPLLEGDVAFDVPDSSCRTFQLNYTTGSVGGSMCFVAVDDVMVATASYTTPMWSYRSADEFAGITLAAIERARN